MDTATLTEHEAKLGAVFERAHRSSQAAQASFTVAHKQWGKAKTQLRSLAKVATTIVTSLNHVEIWNGLEILAKVVSARNENIKEEHILSIFKKIKTHPSNVNSQEIDIIIDCLLGYAEQIANSLQRREEDNWVSSRQSYEKTRDFLSWVKGYKNYKASIIKAFLESMSKATVTNAVNSVLNITHICSDVKPDVISNAARWFRYALHTEMQLVALLNSSAISLVSKSPIFSIAEPCPSCERGAPLTNWARTDGHYFISFHKDSQIQHHLVEDSQTQQYITETENPNNATYVTIGADW